MHQEPSKKLFAKGFSLFLEQSVKASVQLFSGGFFKILLTIRRQCCPGGWRRVPRDLDRLDFTKALLLLLGVLVRPWGRRRESSDP